MAPLCRRRRRRRRDILKAEEYAHGHDAYPFGLDFVSVCRRERSRAEPAQPAPAPPAKTIVNLVRDAIAENDFKKAEKLVLDDMAANGTTPIAIEAFSWLGRGLVAAKRYDEAMTYAARTYEIVEEQLKTRKLDDEARLPIALGAAIEVQALALAGQGKRSEAIMTLQREIEQYKGTSIIMRLNKNMNLLSLEGQPAFPIESQEWLGPKTSLAALKGKPVVLFLWAHWCGDCKTQGPILDALVNKYKSTGITVIAPTQRFGYVEKRQPAGPAEEMAYHRAGARPVLSVDEDRVSAGERRPLPSLWCVDDADLRHDR